MLVVLSDLHLTDRTSGVQAVCADTYQAMFKMLRERADAVGATEVTILYLGDIFDMIRTTTWFEHEDVHPWDTDGDPRVVGVAHRILRQIAGERVDIFRGQIPDYFEEKKWSEVEEGLKEREQKRLQENPRIFELLRNPDLGLVAGRPRKVTNLYIPGNHDRILNTAPRLRRAVREILNIQDGRGAGDEFPTTVELPDYGVFARHGHEWDEMSFATGRRVSVRRQLEIDARDYATPPISELMALEFSSRLPPMVRNRLIRSGVSVKDALAVEDRLSELDDVRPTHAIFPWIVQQVSGTPAEEITRKVMRELAERVLAHEFYRRCKDRPRHLPVLLWVMRHLWLPGMLPLFRLVGEFGGIVVQRHMRRAGRREVALLQAARNGSPSESRFPWLRFFLVGHTHLPIQWPATRLEGSDTDVLYVNTGTWRPYHHQALDSRGFCRIESLTCTLVLQRRFDKNVTVDEPTLEQWSWQSAKKSPEAVPAALKPVGTGLGNRLRSMLESAQSQFTPRRPLDGAPERP